MTTTVDRQQDGCDGADLVARCRRGDRDAWPDFVARFAPYVHTIAVRGYRLSEQDGEDVFQEVFLRAWTREAARADVDTVHDVPSADLLGGLDESLMVRAIEQMPGIHRDIVDRFFVEGQSHAAIAADLGIAEGTVAGRVARARTRLRANLAS